MATKILSLHRDVPHFYSKYIMLDVNDSRLDPSCISAWRERNKLAPNLLFRRLWKWPIWVQYWLYKFVLIFSTVYSVSLIYVLPSRNYIFKRLSFFIISNMQMRCARYTVCGHKFQWKFLNIPHVVASNFTNLRQILSMGVVRGAPEYGVAFFMRMCRQGWKICDIFAGNWRK